MKTSGTQPLEGVWPGPRAWTPVPLPTADLGLPNPPRSGNPRLFLAAPAPTEILGQTPMVARPSLGPGAAPTGIPGSHRRKRVDGLGPGPRGRSSTQTSTSKARWAAAKNFLASSFAGSNTRRSSAYCRTAGQSRRSAASSIWSRIRSIGLWNRSLAMIEVC